MSVEGAGAQAVAAAAGAAASAFAAAAAGAAQAAASAAPPAAAAPSSLGDLVHSLFVLLTTFAYALPAWEGWQRRSLHHAALFTLAGAASFALHCGETGVCAPLRARAHANLTAATATLGYYVAFVMAGVVLEVRSEALLRVAGAVACAAIAARDASATAVNVAVVAAVSLLVFSIDVAVHARRFTPAFWKRLAVIACIAAGGWALLRLLAVLWVWHGLWHVYSVASCYLLLLAQRHKRLSLAAKAGRGGGGGGGGGAGAAAGGPGRAAAGARSRAGVLAGAAAEPDATAHGVLDAVHRDATPFV